MSRERIIVRAALILLLAAAVGTLAGWVGRRMNHKEVVNVPVDAVPVQPQIAPFPAPDFELIDQDGRALRTTDLRGRVWIADFFFTTCAGPCPLMTRRMATLQERITHPDLRLVSFSVDPVHDTPAVLKEYALANGADPRWSFLTGKPEAVYELATALKLGVSPADRNNPIFHSTKFVLVDREGQIRGYFDSGEPGAMDQLLAEATALLKN